MIWILKKSQIELQRMDNRIIQRFPYKQKRSIEIPKGSYTPPEKKRHQIIDELRLT